MPSLVTMQTLSASPVYTVSFRSRDEDAFHKSHGSVQGQRDMLHILHVLKTNLVGQETWDEASCDHAKEAQSPPELPQASGVRMNTSHRRNEDGPPRETPLDLAELPTWTPDKHPLRHSPHFWSSLRRGLDTQKAKPGYRVCGN